MLSLLGISKLRIAVVVLLALALAAATYGCVAVADARTGLEFLPLYEARHHIADPTEASTTPKLVSGRLEVDPDAPGGLALCEWAHEVKDDKRYRAVTSGTYVGQGLRVVSDAGTTYQIAAATLVGALWLPSRLAYDTPRESFFRSQIALIGDAPGRIGERCIAHGEHAVIEACLSRSADHMFIVPCKKRRAIVTVGPNIHPRLRISITDKLGSFALASFGAFFLLALLHPRHGTKLAPKDAIDAWAAETKVSRVRVWLVRGAYALLTLGLLAYAFFDFPSALLGIEGTRWGHVIAVLFLALAASASQEERHHYRKAQRALRIVLDTATSELATLRPGTFAELEVRVRDDGQGERAITLQEAVPFFRRDLYRVYRTTGKNATTRWHKFASTYHGDRIPVEDASGPGWLLAEGATLDLPVNVHRIEPSDARSGPFAELFVHQLAEPHLRFEIAEAYVRPGQALYVLGQVVRTELGEEALGYRGRRHEPVIGDAGAAKLLVTTESQATLEARLRAEWLCRRAHFHAVVLLSISATAALVIASLLPIL